MILSSTEIVAIIVALGAVIVNIITAIRMGNKVETISQVTARSLVETGVLQGKVQEVHVLTNQNLSDVRNELKQANNDRATLLTIISDLKSEREKVATAAAYNTPTVKDRPARATDATPASTPVPIATIEEPLPVHIIAKEPVPVDIQEKKPKASK